MVTAQIGNNRLLIDGFETSPLPKQFDYSSVYQTNSNVYWNGYRYIKETNSWKWSLYGWLMCR